MFSFGRFSEEGRKGGGDLTSKKNPDGVCQKPRNLADSRPFLV